MNRKGKSSPKKREIKKTKLSLAELAQRDKRETAEHEAAHLTVGLAQGLWARAILERNTAVADPVAMKLWRGQCQFLMCTPTPAVHIAGYLVSFRQDDGTLDIEMAIDCFDPDDLSATDLAGLPDDNDEEMDYTLALAANLLRSHWKFWLWAVETLMKDEYISEEVASACFAKLKEKPSKAKSRRRR